MISDFGFNGTRSVPPPVNEPVKAYAPGSPERAELKARLKAMASERIEIPLVIGGKEVRGAEKATAVMPHDHGHVLATSFPDGTPAPRFGLPASCASVRTNLSRFLMNGVSRPLVSGSSVT